MTNTPGENTTMETFKIEVAVEVDENGKVIGIYEAPQEMLQALVDERRAGRK